MKITFAIPAFHFPGNLVFQNSEKYAACYIYPWESPEACKDIRIWMSTGKRSQLSPKKA